MSTKRTRRKPKKRPVKEEDGVRSNSTPKKTIAAAVAAAAEVATPTTADACSDAPELPVVVGTSSGSAVKGQSLVNGDTHPSGSKPGRQTRKRRGKEEADEDDDDTVVDAGGRGAKKRKIDKTSSLFSRVFSFPEPQTSPPSENSSSNKVLFSKVFVF